MGFGYERFTDLPGDIQQRIRLLWPDGAETQLHKSVPVLNNHSMLAVLNDDPDGHFIVRQYLYNLDKLLHGDLP